jgi:hypothetical protein
MGDNRSRPAKMDGGNDLLHAQLAENDGKHDHPLASVVSLK